MVLITGGLIITKANKLQKAIPHTHTHPASPHLNNYLYDETTSSVFSSVPAFCLSFTSATAACIIFGLSSADRLTYQPCNNESSSRNLNHSTSQPGMMKRYEERRNIARLCTRNQPKDANIDGILSCFEVQPV